MNNLRTVSRIIVGLVFMFSGIVKAVDPLGSAYKFSDYFVAFGISFLRPFSLYLAIILFSAEFISGFSVISGYRQKTGTWGVFILMCIFTPLTLVLALTNPVTDCGCFGDAIHLSNWQTFGKNIILIFLVLILIPGRKEIKPVLAVHKEWGIILFVTTLFVVFSLMNLRYLPLFDFLPYKTGINISENMKIPEGKPVDEYVTTFIYEKEGFKKEFTLENYPAEDTSWKFVDQKSVLVKKGYQPPIHDFMITSTQGRDITSDILDYKGYVMLMISKKMNEAHPENLEKGFELGSKFLKEGIAFYVLTASGSDEISKYIIPLPLCTADETTLKTMIRANPGYILIKDGTIAAKWSWANVPAMDNFSKDMALLKSGVIKNKSLFLIIYSVMLSVTILILLIITIHKGNFGKTENRSL